METVKETIDRAIAAGMVFPCPGCGAQLVDVHGFGFAEAGPYRVGFDSNGVSYGVERYHTTFSTACALRALVAAVRSLDAGQRDHAQIETLAAAKRDRLINDLAGRIRDYMEHQGFTAPLPTREDFEDRDNPLIGNRCTHGLRLDEPCVKCDEATTHCDPPCGARHDQPPAAHHPTCRRRIESCPYQAKGGGKCALPYGHEHDGVHDKAPGYPEDRAITAPDADPVYGPCGVCGDNHVTEDHEAAPEGGSDAR